MQRSTVCSVGLWVLGLLSVAAVASAKAPAPRLFYFDTAKKGTCVAKLRDVRSGRETTLFTTAACPAFLLWNTPAKELVSVEGQHVWTRPLASPASTARDLGPVPQGELGPMGWQRLEATPTRWEAGDTEGVGALRTPKKIRENVMSLGNLVAQSTLATQSHAHLQCDEVPPAALRALNAKEEAGACLLDLDGSHELVFATIFGDTPHAAPPVVICSEKCKKSRPLKEITASQISIAAAAGYVLVTNEYANDNAMVFDFDGKRVLALPQALGAVWFPEL